MSFPTNLTRFPDAAPALGRGAIRDLGQTRMRLPGSRLPDLTEPLNENHEVSGPPRAGRTGVNDPSRALRPFSFNARSWAEGGTSRLQAKALESGRSSESSRQPRLPRSFFFSRMSHGLFLS